MTKYILFGFAVWFMLINSSNGCVTHKASIVAKLTKCHRLLKEVIITADTSTIAENFEIAYCNFINECENGDEQKEESNDSSENGFETALIGVLKLDTIPSCNKNNTNGTENTNDEIITDNPDETTGTNNEDFTEGDNDATTETNDEDFTGDENDTTTEINDEDIADDGNDTEEIIDDGSGETTPPLEGSGERLQESVEELDESKKDWEEKEVKILAKLLQLF